MKEMKAAAIPVPAISLIDKTESVDKTEPTLHAISLTRISYTGEYT